MSEEKSKTDDKFNKYMAIALVIVIIFAIGVLAYTNLVEKESENSDNDQPFLEEFEEKILSISVDSSSYNYSLNELITFDSVSGRGGYINRIDKITGPNNYTGVSILVLLNSIEEIPEIHTINAIASDGYALNYSINELNGHVSVFNKTGNETGKGDLTMIIAFKENGKLLNETTYGPLRIVFIDDKGSITNSSLWLRSLVKLEVSKPL